MPPLLIPKTRCILPTPIPNTLPSAGPDLTSKPPTHHSTKRSHTMGNNISSHHELLFGGVPGRDRDGGRAWVRPSRNQRRYTAPSGSRPPTQGGRGGRLPSERGPPPSRGGERRSNGPPRHHPPPPGPRFHDNEPYDDEEEREQEGEGEDDVPEFMSAPDPRGQRRGPRPGEPGPPRNPSRRPSRSQAPERQPRVSNAERQPLPRQRHHPPPPASSRHQPQSRTRRSVSNVGPGARGDRDGESRRGGEGEGAARRRQRR